MMILTKIINALMPPVCYGCRSRLLSHEQYFCTSCMSKWSRPNLHENAVDNKLARLFWGFFPIEGAAAAYIYTPGTSIAPLLHNMKYRRKPALCRLMGRLMTQDDLISSLLADADVLIPVPLTPKRQRERHYNQSEELCKGIVEGMQLNNNKPLQASGTTPLQASGTTPLQASGTTPLMTCADVLQRVKFADSQTTMTREERLRNIRGAFKLTDGDKVAGKHVVIVDDVITTGATVSECILMLRDVPDIRISVLSLAWTHNI